MEHILLFPETPDINPSSFLNSYELINCLPVPIRGYKLYSFIDCLDELGYPFWAAVIPCEGKITKFYQFKAYSDSLDFSNIGIEIKRIPEGELLYLSTEHFNELSSKYGCSSVKDGDWGKESVKYHKLAAYFHLDILENLSSDTFKCNFDVIDSLSKKVQKSYNFSITSSLPNLYLEAYSILKFFGFIEKGECIEPNELNYFFGSFKNPIRKFLISAFQNYFMEIVQCHQW